MARATINRVCALALTGILANPDVQVIFITGKAGYVETSLLLKDSDSSVLRNERLCFLEYTHDMPYALAAADVVIGRAGATFLAEIAMCGLPGILIPYPYASDNHQQFNAQAVVDAGAGEMILDAELTVPKLTAALNNFLCNDDYYQAKKEAMQGLARPSAMDDIMMLVQSFAKIIHLKEKVRTWIIQKILSMFILLEIGGIGMSAVAEVMLERGFVISGSDLNESDQVQIAARVAARRSTCHKRAENITDDIDIVVRSTAIRETNVEYQAAVEKGIPVVHRSEMLGYLMQSQKSHLRGWFPWQNDHILDDRSRPREKWPRSNDRRWRRDQRHRQQR